MWSGTGKFTGQKMTLPFYCISLGKESSSKIWRYMDPSGLNKEVTAFEDQRTQKSNWFSRTLCK